MKRLVCAHCCWLALAVPAFADEPPLGRLFLTPEQRAALDNARRNRIRAEALAAAADKKPKIPPARSVTINGVVSRSDGESTVWVNGHPTEGETEDGMRVSSRPERTPPSWCASRRRAARSGSKSASAPIW